MLLQSSNSSNSKGTLMPVPSPPSNWIHFGTHGAEADKQERTRCSIARESTNCSVRAFSYRIRLTGGKVSVVICFGSQEKLRGKLGKHSVSFSAARQIGEPYYTIHILDSWFLGKLEVNLLRGKPFLRAGISVVMMRPVVGMAQIKLWICSTSHMALRFVVYRVICATRTASTLDLRFAVSPAYTIRG